MLSFPIIEPLPIESNEVPTIKEANFFCIFDKKMQGKIK
jgi:hypothetical protein